MSDKIMYKLKSMKTWHLLCLSVLLAEVFTEIIVCLMSLLFHGRIRYDYLITGGVTAFLVSMAVNYLRNYFTNAMREIESQAATFSKTVLNSMNEAVSVIDVKDHLIVSCNKVFLKELGFQEEDVIGKTCYEITHRRSVPCTPPDNSCPIRKTVETGEYAAAEHVHYT